MSNGNNPTPIRKGKAGNFSTAKNLFSAHKAKGSAPKLADSSGLLSALDELLAAGNAVMLGNTRDCGALVFTVLEGDERHRTYCSSDEELDGAIVEIHERYKVD